MASCGVQAVNPLPINFFHIDDLDFATEHDPKPLDEFVELCLDLGFIPCVVYLSGEKVVGGANVCAAVRDSQELLTLTDGYVPCIELGKDAIRFSALLAYFNYYPKVHAPLRKNVRHNAKHDNKSDAGSGIHLAQREQDSGLGEAEVESGNV